MTAQHDGQTSPRYPLTPLLNAANIRSIPDGTEGGDHTGDPLAGYTLLAFRLGITRQAIQRLARTGLSDRQADHYAIAIGIHPGFIWPEWWTNAPHAAEPRCSRSAHS